MTVTAINWDDVVKEMDRLSLRVAEAPTINTVELVAIYQYIVKHPRRWDQNTWGTRKRLGRRKFCFAGIAALRAGAEPVWLKDYANGKYAIECTTPDGTQMSIRTYAQNVLGLTDYQQRELFRSTNRLPDFRYFIRQWADVDPAAR